MIKVITSSNISPKSVPVKPTQAFGGVAITKECKQMKNPDEAMNTLASELNNANSCDAYPYVTFENEKHRHLENVLKVVKDEVSENPCLKRLVAGVHFKDKDGGKELMIGQLRTATNETIAEFLQSNSGRDLVKSELSRLTENIMKD